MKFLSLCSGIEAASAAWHPLGFECVGVAEIEAFPSAVLAYRYPQVPNYGDISEFLRWPERVFEEADIIVGGPPCQSFSIAGLRKGLDDERGNLTLTYARIIDHADRLRLRSGKPPVICVYENVPGIFSDKTNAFGNLIGGLSGEDVPLEPPGGKWTHCGAVLGPQRAIAWRVQDAQYHGLAQRRQRVFVVSSARDGFDPSQVLLEWEGVRRDSAPIREARKNPAAALGVGVAERRGDVRGHGAGHGSLSHWDGPQHPHPTLNQSFNTGAIGYSNQELFSQRGAGLVGDRDVVDAITARYGGQAMGAPEVDAGLYIPLPETEVVGCLSDGAHNGGGLNGQDAYTGRILASVAPSLSIGFSVKDYGADAQENITPTLRAMNHTDSHANGGGQLGVVAPSREPAQGSFPWPQEVADPLTSNEAKTYTHEGTTFRTRNVVPHVVEADEPSPEPQGFYTTDGRFNGIPPAGLSPPLKVGTGTGGTGNTGAAYLVRDEGDAGDPPAYCYPDADQLGYAPGDETGDEAPTQHVVAPALTASNDPSRSPQSTEVTQQVTAVLAASQPRMVVRRLTPRECERLQGFAPDWTLIPWKNKPAVDCPDGPRYKALGNSMAVPVMRWIGRRIDAHVKGTSP